MASYNSDEFKDKVQSLGAKMAESLGELRIFAAMMTIVPNVVSGDLEKARVALGKMTQDELMAIHATFSTSRLLVNEFIEGSGRNARG